MLSQAEADALLGMPKMLVDLVQIKFPGRGDELRLEARSVNGKELFLFDVNRRGHINLKKCTYQNRHSVDILLRLDLNGPPHRNPDGDELPCPHIHVYREGFADKWAFPVPSDFRDTNDLITSLQDFLQYSKVQEIPEIQRSMF